MGRQTGRNTKPWGNGRTGRWGRQSMGRSVNWDKQAEGYSKSVLGMGEGQAGKKKSQQQQACKGKGRQGTM